SSPSENKAEQGNIVDEQGTFVIRKDVDEVMLHATVVDDKKHIITSLDRSAFTVFEDGKPQNIISFHHVDIPVAMGIVIDNSGSMREKRSKVNQAALNLVRSSNPRDEVFIVNFNDEQYLDQDFTHDLLKLKKALEIIAERTGGIAFFPKTLDEVDSISRTIANDIRNQYAIGYKPLSPKKAGEFRQIRVEAKAKGHSKLVVRTKSGYYAGAEA